MPVNNLIAFYCEIDDFYYRYIETDEGKTALNNYYGKREVLYMKNEIKLYKDGALEVPVTVSPEENTVWLNRNQLAILFNRDVKTIGKHINNALKEELDNSVVAKFATTGTDGKTYNVEHYNLDMIISVGYRVKSKQGIAFRKWANSILRSYILKGYAVNEKRLNALNKVVNIQSRIIANTLELDEEDV